MANIQALLDKMTSVDKDLRYMACSDILPELRKPDFKLNERMEMRLVVQILKLLEDVNGEVQTMAVKCVPLLITRVSVDQVERIVNTLVEKMSSQTEQLRDVCIIGIKSIFTQIGPESPIAFLVCKKLITPLISKLDQPDDAASSTSESLDVLNDLLTPFGRLVPNEHAILSTKLTALLRSKRPFLRKRAISCLATLHRVSSPALCTEFLLGLLTSLSQKQTKANRRTDLQCLTALITRAPDRVSGHVDAIIKVAISSAAIRDDDELLEAALQCIEAIIRLGQQSLISSFSEIIALCVSLLTYDPNYDPNVEIDEGEEDEEDADFSGDDDMSWKIRKAAATCLGVLATAYPSLLSQFCTLFAPQLLDRFKEREESARTEILHTFTIILQQTSRYNGMLTIDPNATRWLVDLAPRLVASIAKPLQDKSVKSRYAAVALLREYCTACPTGLGGNTASLLPHLFKLLKEKSLSSNVKIETLSLLSLIVRSLPPSSLMSDLPALCGAAVAASSDAFYKIVAEALNLIGVLAYTIRANLSQPISPTLVAPAEQLYDAAVGRFAGPDTDQDIREKSTLAVAHLIAVLGEEHTLVRQQCLPVLLARMHNEVTRMVATKALTIIAVSPLRIELSSILQESLALLSSFLAKNNRALRLQSLQALMVLIGSWDDRSTLELCGLLRLSLGDSPDASQKRRRVTARTESFTDSETFEEILKALVPIISPNDMQSSQIALRVGAAIVQSSRPAAAAIVSRIPLLPAVIQLSRSPLVQSNVLDGLVLFFRAIMTANTPGLDYSVVSQMLSSVVVDSTDPLPRNAYTTLGACVAASAQASSQLQSASTLFIADLKNTSSKDTTRLFALASLGEMGRQADLSGNPDVLDAILAQFQCESDDVRNAAATTLGLVCTGNLATYVPFITDLMTSQPERQFFLLHALKELIDACVQSNMVAVLAPFADRLWALLIKISSNPSESTRATIGDCLGRLTLVTLDRYVAELVNNLRDGSASVRATMIVAIKVAVCYADPSPSLSSALKAALLCMDDAELTVRREALMAFNSAAHNRPNILLPLLSEMLPLVYRNTGIRPELIRVVEMGPFKHNVDDGLDSRKTAFECLYSLLKSCRSAIDVSSFIDCCLKGLADQYDIQMLCFLIISRLAVLYPEDMLRRLDDFANAFNPIVNAQPKSNAVQQEIDKIDELKRNALKAIASLDKLPGSDKCAKLTALLATINETPALQRHLKTIQDLDSTNFEF